MTCTHPTFDGGVTVHRTSNDRLYVVEVQVRCPACGARIEPLGAKEWLLTGVIGTAPTPVPAPVPPELSGLDAAAKAT